MVYGDRNYNQKEAIANLNSTSPLSFPDPISAEELAKDLDLFASTIFVDFDYGSTNQNAGEDNTFTTSLDSGAGSENKEPDGANAHLGSLSNDHDIHHFNFLSDSLSFDLNSLHADEESGSKRQRTEVKPEDAASSSSKNLSGEENTRMAAEEDKRRRNTLASARFRAKKKMREQALEKDHKEMSAKIDKLENRIKELELENKWLRGLVVQNKP